jgi:hypothetical protein
MSYQFLSMGWVAGLATVQTIEGLKHCGSGRVVEGIINLFPLAARRHHAFSAQDPKLLRQCGLADPCKGFQVAHIGLSLRQLA